MRLSNHSFAHVGLFLILAASVVHGATSFLPGLELGSSTDKLAGRLVFLYSSNGWLKGQAQIYEVNLRRHLLRRVADAPSGDFFAANDGQTFCVRHGLVTGLGLFLTNAFAYSERLHQSQRFVLAREPEQISFEGSRVYFGFAHHPMLMGDVVTGSLDRVDPEVQQRIELARHGESHYLGWKTEDGRWVFFTGDDGPFRGARLVSSPWNLFDTRSQDSEGSKVRTLQKYSTPLQGSYWLHQLSPCGRYALVRRTLPKGDGWNNTYHLVNLTDGATSVLLRDTVCHDGRAWMSQIRWVPDILIPPPSGTTPSVNPQTK